MNGLQYDRAGQHYWDSVAAATDDRWSWDNVLDAYREIENHELGASPTCGSDGPLHVHVSRKEEPLTRAIIDAAENYGLPFTASWRSTPPAGSPPCGPPADGPPSRSPSPTWSTAPAPSP